MKLLKYFVTIIIAALLIAAGLSFLINKGLKRSSIDFYRKINYVLNDKTNIDILLVGSSRILTNIDPHIIDSITKLHSYNSGLNAATIKTCFNIITAGIKKQSHLKYIILNIDYNMFRPGIDPYKDAYYYPFTSDGSTFVYSKTPANTIHKIKFLDVAAYDDYAKYAALRGIVSPTQNTGNGFFPHSEQGFAIPDNKLLQSDTEKYNEQDRQLLEKIINMCKEKNVELMLVIAPYQKNYAPVLFIKNYSEIVEWVTISAKKNAAYFFDYTQLPLAAETSYFYNSWHLNIKGATAYSKQVGNDLKQFIIQKNGDRKPGTPVDSDLKQ